MPMGRAFTIPGEMLMGGYKHDLNEQVSLELKEGYVDAFGLMDPGIGLTYRIDQLDGWSPFGSLTTFLPATQISESDNTLIKVLAKVSETYRSHRWATFGGLSYMRVFFNGNPAPNPGPPAEPMKSGTTGASTTQLSQASGGPVPSLSAPGQFDFVFFEKDVQRSSASLSESFNISHSARVSSGGALTQIETDGGHRIWFSSVNAINVSYMFGQWMLASGLTYYSDLSNYNRPTLPNQWNVGMMLAYNMGDDPPELR